MNKNDFQELKPIYIHEASNPASDEINLVDLATTLVRRKVLIITIFILSTALGVTTALFSPKIYTFSTTINIGSQIINGSAQPLETPETLLAKLQHSYIPQVLIEKSLANPENKDKFKVIPSIPGINSNILLIEIQGTEDQGATIRELLQLISQKAIQDHTRIYQSVKGNLDAMLKKANNNLKSPENTGYNIESSINQNFIESLSNQLANLRNTREVQPPIRSIDPTGRSQKFIVIIFAVAGIFLGVFAAFFTGFVSKVKQKINKEAKDS